MAARVKTLMAAYKDARDLINIGAYHRGSNKDIDEAIEKMPEITKFLQQDVDESKDYGETLDYMGKLV